MSVYLAQSGREGGLRGGPARAKRLSPEMRRKDCEEGSEGTLEQKADGQNQLGLIDSLDYQPRWV